MTVMLGAQRGRELGTSVERHVAHRGAKPLQHDHRVAPLARWRGLRVGGRWHVSGDEGKDPAEKQLRRPRVEGEDPTPFQDAKHFFDGDLGARREDVRELAEHHVELAVCERRALHTAFLPHDVVQSRERGVFLRDREQRRRQVAAGDPGARPSRGCRRGAGAAPDVQGLRPGTQARKVHEPSRARSRRLSERRERLPDLSLGRLERVEGVGSHGSRGERSPGRITLRLAASTGKALKKSRRYRAVPTKGRVLMMNEKVATELKGSVRGDVILPDDGRYDEARKVYNAMIDKRPAVVVRCTGVAAVIAAVKADGWFVTANAKENQDLFWALRGGGGNFGVVTSFQYKLQPVRNITGGPMFFEKEDAEKVMRTFDEYISRAPRELGAFFAWQIAPPLPFIPEDRHGDTLCVLVACWTGPPSEAEEALAPLRGAADVVAAHVGPMPYPALNSAFDGLVPPGLQHYWKAVFAKDLSDGAIEAHLANGPKVPVVNSTMHIYPINGAVHDVASDATAFGHREAKYAMVIAGMWPDPAQNEASTQWVKNYYKGLAPHAEEGGYINFAAGDDMNRVRANFGVNYDRLCDVKAKYDSENVFRHNQNISPA